MCTPLVYGIGNASEHIVYAAAHAKRSGKKLLIFKTRYFQKFLRYHICNNALFDSLILNNQINKKNFFCYFGCLKLKNQIMHYYKCHSVEISENIEF